MLDDNNISLEDYSDNRRSWFVTSNLSLNYRIKYSPRVFSTDNPDLIEIVQDKRVIIVIDKNIYALHLENLKRYFDHYKIQLHLLVLEMSEINKDWENAKKILEFFEHAGLKRRENVVAIGGGVLLDLVGFSCSVFRRGVPYIKIPTTLLAIIDASVGAKVGINYFNKRNRLGSYFPAAETLIDKSFIKSQSSKEIINGMGEIFKLAVIKSPVLFNILDASCELLLREKFQAGAVPNKVINLSITNMVDELAPNLWEKNLERCVDFGHIFSPVIEMKNRASLSHGEAVALDCIFSSSLAYHRKLISFEVLSKIAHLAKKIQLPVFHQDFTNLELLTESLNDSTLHRNGMQNVPIPVGIGVHAFLNDISELDLVESIAIFETLKDLS